ncbi:MAG TPA: heparinase II/III family protein [Candidatus Dormibacteraeota bacterium]|nr:heparinase II/III family protein [Candidatus Dormibacteraeota bacterium]
MNVFQPRFVGACLVLIVSALSIAAAETPKGKPARTNILSTLQSDHPRLLVSATGFARLAKTDDAKFKSWRADLKKQADQILSAPPSKYEIPDGLRLLETSRRVVNRVYTLGLMYRLEADSRYAERAWKELEAAAHFQDWNPRHFLDTAEMTHAFAIGYDWLYDAWSDEQRQTLRQAIVEKGFKPALPLYRGHKSWTVMRHNWNQVCNGGLGMGALAIGDAEPTVADEILQSALESLPLAMSEFAPEGAWKEGPGYWNYATMYNVVFLAALETALGKDFGLSETPGFGQTGFFPLYLTSPLGRTFNYADGGDKAIHAPQLFWLARKFKQPVFAWSEIHSQGANPLDLLWYQPDLVGPNQANLPLNRYFRAAEVVSMRSAWEEPKALFVGFKAGSNKANHSHLDLGSFVFDAVGVRWAVDLGADDYNLPGYFGPQRWNYYRLRAEGQNTLVINPGSGTDQDPGASSTITRFDSKADRTFAIADLSAAYRQHASRVCRGIQMLDRKKVIIQDEIQAPKPAEVWWFMHTPASVLLEGDGRSARLKQVNAELRVELLSPPGAKFEIMDAQPLPSSPHPPKQARNENVRKLAIHLSNVTDTRITVLLMAETPTGLSGSSILTLRALSEW